MSKASTTKKAVLQFDKDDNFIQEFESISAAAATIETKGQKKSIEKKISGVCNGTGKTAYKYIWRFK